MKIQQHLLIPSVAAISGIMELTQQEEKFLRQPGSREKGKYYGNS